tara:strand:- start:287 stop:799 length:513 start_codon:yes stop_codon:yes gene_type:complete
MSGSLIKITETTVSSAVSSVTLTGIDSTFDVYMVTINNLDPDTNAQKFRVRFTVSGTADTSSNYDKAYEFLRNDSTFSDRSGADATFIDTDDITSTAGQGLCGTMYLFNFNNSSEFSFCTFETVHRNGSNTFGMQGGGVLTVAQTCDGIQFFMESGNIELGTFKLYGLKK